MKINLQGVTANANRKKWAEKGYTLPQYDIAQVMKATKSS